MKEIQTELCKMPVEFRKHREVFTDDEQKRIQDSRNFVAFMTQKVIGVEKINCKLKIVEIMTYQSKLDTSMQARLKAAGIKFIKEAYSRKNDTDGYNYFLEYNNEKKPAPWVTKCPMKVKQWWGLTI